MTEEFQIGVVTQTHGIKGEVKVFPTTDDVRRFKKLKLVTADTGKSRIALHVSSVKFFKQYVILLFEEYSDINDVMILKGAKLLVDRDNAVPLAKNEFYVADLIGLAVTSDEGEDLGVISDVMQTGANDVYVIKKNDREILLPAIKECILNTDIEQGSMLVHVLEGLR